MKYYFKIMILISILCVNFMFSQETEDVILHAKQHGYNSLYRANYFDKMILKLDVNSDLDNFYIPKLNITENSKSRFVPNERYKLRFSFDYKFLGFTISYSPNFLPGNNDNNKKGDTKTLDLSFKFFYSDQWRQEVTFKKIKGFYLENPNIKTPISVFDQLEMNTFGGKTILILNKKFSYRSFESLTERQVIGDGSFIPAVSYYLNDLQTNNSNMNSIYLDRIKSWEIGIQTGYMYNFVLNKKWFSTVGLHPGISLNESINYYFNPLNKEKIKNKSINLDYKVDFNFALGYNNRNFFLGFKSNYKNFKYNNKKNIQIYNSKNSIELFIGYRFNEINPIKRRFKLIEKRLRL